MKDLVILGAGGNCVDILDAVLEINARESEPVFQVRGFLDDNPDALSKGGIGDKVIGSLATASQLKDCVFVNGIGSFRSYWTKPQLIANVGIEPERFVTIVHPQASVSRFARLGRGTVILQNATVNARAEIGNHVMVLPGAIVSHDARVGDYCCLASGACLAGGVQVGPTCYLGANCSINNDVIIEELALIGMGAVVLKNVSARMVVVGNPARVVRQLPNAEVKGAAS
jgi:sugar O-acyltransferase (sialic acid O-acetyltransferase NeuD family)